MFDIIKANLRFGMYRYATTDIERRLAGLIDDKYENNLERRLTGARRMVSIADAMLLRDIAEFAKVRPGKTPDEPFSEWAADELATMMRWTRNTARNRLHLALTLTTRLPGTLEALSRGDIELRGAQALAEITAPLDDATAGTVERTVLPKAATKNLSELRRAARRAVQRLDPDGAKQRHEARKRERSVELLPMDDAMAEITAYLPAADATAIYRRIDEFAHAIRGDDDRTLEQIRADVFTDLLLGTGAVTDGTTTTAGSGRGKPLIQVTIPASTLMGMDNQPGELAGYGPIPADVARDIAAGGTWKRLIHDPITGTLLDYGRTTYRPPAGLADFVIARDQRCIFPGCSTRPNAAILTTTKPTPTDPPAKPTAAACAGTTTDSSTKPAGPWNTPTASTPGPPPPAASTAADPNPSPNPHPSPHPPTSHPHSEMAPAR